jgi:hypothetical protein
VTLRTSELCAAGANGAGSGGRGRSSGGGSNEEDRAPAYGRADAEGLKPSPSAANLRSSQSPMDWCGSRSDSTRQERVRARVRAANRYMIHLSNTTGYTRHWFSHITTHQLTTRHNREASSQSCHSQNMPSHHITAAESITQTTSHDIPWRSRRVRRLDCQSESVLLLSGWQSGQRRSRQRPEPKPTPIHRTTAQTQVTHLFAETRQKAEGERCCAQQPAPTLTLTPAQSRTARSHPSAKRMAKAKPVLASGSFTADGPVRITGERCDTTPHHSKQ